MSRRASRRTLLVLFILASSLSGVLPEAIQVNEDNYESIKAENNFLLMNFYADWCRFSQQLKPIFDQAADRVRELNIESVALAKVDCPSAGTLCRDVFHISKYPTLKVVKFGQIMRKEYRGKRAVADLVEFTKNMVTVPIESFGSDDELKVKMKRNSIVGYFSDEGSHEYRVYRETAALLSDGCDFFSNIRPNTQSLIQFVPHMVTDTAITSDYQGDLQSSGRLYEWVLDHCVELVREITFQNGEEFTEEGLPFLLLFYAPGDEESKKLFKQKVQEEVAHERMKINFLFADGKMFSHPLYHLGKSIKDLPVVAIDSFQHMYLLPSFEEIKQPGRLQQFIDDLYSGKLHHEFHHGPSIDLDEFHLWTDNACHKFFHQTIIQLTMIQPLWLLQPTEQVKPSTEDTKEKRSAPPESTFKNLKPDNDRYTLLRQRDEL